MPGAGAHSQSVPSCNSWWHFSRDRMSPPQQKQVLPWHHQSLQVCGWKQAEKPGSQSRYNLNKIQFKCQNLSVQNSAHDTQKIFFFSPLLLIKKENSPSFFKIFPLIWRKTSDQGKTHFKKKIKKYYHPYHPRESH